MKKMILVLCGAGVATSTVAKIKAEEICKEIGIEADVIIRQIREMKTQSNLGKVDLVIAMTPGLLDTMKLDAPLISGFPFITGVNKQETIEEIKRILLNG